MEADQCSLEANKCSSTARAPKRRQNWCTCESDERWKNAMRLRAINGMQVVSQYNTQGFRNFHGSAFNVAFNESGSHCVVLYELAAFKLFDTRTHKCVNTVTAAHNGCVNCARFVEGNTLLTGSDDCTVGVWDMRNLDAKICRLEGHKGWVKSIEYDRITRLLLTGAFDKRVRVWDLLAATRQGAHVSQSQTTVKLDKKVVRLRFDDEARRLVVAHRDRLTVLDQLEASAPGQLRITTQDAESARYNRVALIERSQFPKRSRKLYNVSSIDLLPTSDGSPSQCCVTRSSFLPSRAAMIIARLRLLDQAQRNPRAVSMRDAICIHDLSACNLSYVAKLVNDTDAPFSATEDSGCSTLIYSHSESAEPSGFIKEISVSSCGRLIASPSDAAINIFATDPQAVALDRWTIDQIGCVEGRKRTLALLKKVSVVTPEPNLGAVLCCRFAPFHEPSLVVAGSESGDVHFIDTVL